MKKISILCMVFAVALLPGCGGKKKTDAKKEVMPDQKELAGVQSSTYVALNNTQTGYYDENVEAFVLEEDMNSNVFDGAAQESITTAQAVEFDDRAQAGAEFKALYFDFDKYNVRDDQKEALAYDAELIRTAVENGSNVVLEGHADHAAGSKEYNLLLSQKRAYEVARLAQEEFEIDATHIKVVGRGDTMPKVVGGDREQQAPNRRVEVYNVDVLA